jgi:hypothetical protein
MVEKKVQLNSVIRNSLGVTKLVSYNQDLLYLSFLML